MHARLLQRSSVLFLSAFHQPGLFSCKICTDPICSTGLLTGGGNASSSSGSPLAGVLACCRPPFSMNEPAKAKVNRANCCLTVISMPMFPSETGCEFIHIPSLVHHGIEGTPLRLSVDTHFQLDEVEIQGTWSHTSPGGVRVMLVTFNEASAITDMTYRQRLVFTAPDVSLTIKSLKAEDEGDYHLNLNMEFHNKTGLVIKEERTVHVTVDGECPPPTRPAAPQPRAFPDTSPVFPQSPCPSRWLRRARRTPWWRTRPT